jgi:hypothetical protein
VPLKAFTLSARERVSYPRFSPLQRFSYCYAPKAHPLRGFFLKKKPPRTELARTRELENRSKNLSKNHVLKGTGFIPYVESPFLISGFSR